MAKKRNVKKEEIVIYTDGSRLGCGAGGWAAAIERPNGKKSMISGNKKDTTNNVMEMTAVIEAVKLFKDPCKIRVRSDSKLVVDGATKWKHNWKRNNYKLSDGKPVKNRELWIEIDKLQSTHSIKFEHVPAHSSNSPIGNIVVDELSREEASKIKK